MRELTFLCRISSFFCSRKRVGIPPMFSWALTRRSQSSCRNTRAYFAWRKPVRFSCNSLGSGYWGGKKQGINSIQLQFAHNTCLLFYLMHTNCNVLLPVCFPTCWIWTQQPRHLLCQAAEWLAELSKVWWCPDSPSAYPPTTGNL